MKEAFFSLFTIIGLAIAYESTGFFAAIAFVILFLLVFVALKEFYKGVL